ncbi:tRNA (adenine(58)-N(1))-methyltransferase non-catalytic subunit trm6 [Knufia obscura]|uniref:tRNA (adenine(58)-N(1))-methyltransferase non-catalytic subunit TRM6 n=2 Tax=Knufia TaxID=430999 RepID=A0AAN8EE77_9EURO|nr:tRNA (adenine(58)-N(1))-methyltransferase non-catalytic subunit trm6 [Knufia obscura]KAK5953564.1 tRNA (adenine(58)-N(1))-methyltransferase non-catalytic subunit trm6 [Knufia fluminis]
MFHKIRPYQYVALRLPSDSVKIEQILPNALIALGKYGSFHTNSIIGRPYHLTFEILDKSEQKDGRELRIVRASEIHAESLLEEAEPDVDLAIAEETSTSTPNAVGFDEYGLPSTTTKSNVNIVDNPENQKLTYTEIEALKSDAAANPKELIAKIMANHSTLDQKTAFSLAKYTLRKQKKYMKRFTVLPVDVGTLTDWMMNEKDFAKIMEIRNETLGLMGSWANVHASGPVSEDEEPRSRYLVVDDTGGLVVAAMAERMGLLHHQKPEQQEANQATTAQAEQQTTDFQPSTSATDPSQPQQQQQTVPPKRPRYDHTPATSNTLTLIHANQQPNLSLLRYFSFDPNHPPSPSDPHPHPLTTHLHTLSWLQLLDPASDATYSQEPDLKTPEELSVMKGNARSNYFRKRRRWTRTKNTVDTVRAGGYNGLVIASFTDPVGICGRLVPLLSGGAQVVVFNPHVEPLMELCDVYSTGRRTAYLTLLKERQQAALEAKSTEVEKTDPTEVKTETEDSEQPNVKDGVAAQIVDDPRFPVDPTLLLTPAIHHSVARPWQVLPGRTHPLMMGKGGAEGGYVMVSTRVIPVQGVVVQARGRQGRSKGKKREVAGDSRADVENERIVKKGRVEEGSQTHEEGMGDVTMLDGGEKAAL